VSARALSFGAVAPAYERFRPGYPERVVEEVLTYARTPIRTALEIGAGTGKATRVFAARGIVVTATDPDAAMLAELRRHVPPTVSTVQATFEDLPLTHTYDLVFAAAALHWTEPVDRWSRVSALLNEDGVFASFAGQLHLDDPAVDDAVRTVRSRALPDDGVPSPDGTPENSPMRWPGTELSRSDRFTGVRQVTIERRVVMSAQDYIGHLSTISAYLQLSPTVRADVFDRILRVLPLQVILMGDLTLHMARAVRSCGTSSRQPHDRRAAAAREGDS
jgi:SAM-dependent methyltransferase